MRTLSLRGVLLTVLTLFVVSHVFALVPVENEIERLLNDVQGRLPITLAIRPAKALPTGVELAGELHLDTRVQPPLVTLSWRWSRQIGNDAERGAGFRSGFGQTTLEELDFIPIQVAAWDPSHLLVTGVRNGSPVSQRWRIVARADEDGRPGLWYDAQDLQGLSEQVGFITAAFRLSVGAKRDPGTRREDIEPLRLMLVQQWPDKSLSLACISSGWNQLVAVPSCDYLPPVAARECGAAGGETWKGVRLVPELRSEVPYVALECGVHRSLGNTYVFHSTSGENGAETALMLYDENKNGSFADPEDGVLFFEAESWFEEGMHLARNFELAGE